MEDLQLHFEFYETISPVDITITWGIHKELSNYLLADDRLFRLFIDVEVSDAVINLCLAPRDTYGKITEPFQYTNLVTASSMMNSLELIFNYFENFFFLNQERLAKVNEKILKMRQPNTPQ